MTAAAGPYLAGCVLLVVAGGAKLRRPAGTQRALVAAGLPAPGWAVRFGGTVELVLGAAAAGSGSGRAALGVAATYALFAAFVVASLRSPGGGGCGCFGETTTPVHPVHVAVDLGIAAAALAVAVDGGLAATPATRAVLVALGAAVAWVAYLVLVPLPRLLGVVGEVGR